MIMILSYHVRCVSVLRLLIGRFCDFLTIEDV